MNFSPPTWVKEAAETALSTVAANHYSHPKGRIRLREAIRDFYSPLFTNLDRPLDINTEILVTSGANEGRSYLETNDVLGVDSPAAAAS
jgi:kynurenine aminotransferase